MGALAAQSVNPPPVARTNGKNKIGADLNKAAKIPAMLANIPLFNEMEPAEIELIARGARELRVARGEVLFQRGDPSTGFYLVVHGQIKLALSSPQGVEKVVELIGPGQSFGEAVMFMGRPYPVYSQALMDSLLLHISKTVIFDGIDHDPGLARKMLAGLSLRLHRLIHDVESCTLHSSTQRVITYLVQRGQEIAAGGKDVDISFPANKNIIASSLNITPETFSRILYTLAEAGLIEVKGKDVHIFDLDNLGSYAQ